MRSSSIIHCPECGSCLPEAPLPCLHCGQGHPGSHAEAKRLAKEFRQREISRRRSFLHLGMALCILLAALLYKYVRPLTERQP